MDRLMTLGTQDAGEVLTLQRAAYVIQAQAHDDLDLPPLAQSLADLVAELAEPQVIAAGWRNGSGRLLAAIRAQVRPDDSQVADIGRLTVVPDRQGQGLGTRLLAAIEQRLPSSVDQLCLFTGERSTANLRLYVRLGYVETGRQSTAAGYDLVHLSKQRTAR